MINVIASIYIKEDKVKEFIKIFSQMYPLS